MDPPSTLCRVQEAYHRDRADRATLENVRTVATKAAIAWGAEARVAERREARRERTSVIAGMMALRKRQTCETEHRSFSENPDLGFVDA